MPIIEKNMMVEAKVSIYLCDRCGKDILKFDKTVWEKEASLQQWKCPSCGAVASVPKSPQAVVYKERAPEIYERVRKSLIN